VSAGLRAALNAIPLQATARFTARARTHRLSGKFTTGAAVVYLNGPVTAQTL